MTAVPPSILPLVSRLASKHGNLDLSRLDSIVVGSEPIPPRSLAEFEKAFSTAGLSPTALRPAYGLAEATLAVTMTPRGSLWTAVEDPRDADAASGQRNTLTSLGPSLSGYRVTVADGNGGEQEGRIAIEGPSLLDGYIGRFPTRPAAAGRLVTSDLGFMADGELVVQGRVDDLVFRAGRKIFLSSIEDAVFRRTRIPRQRLQAVMSDGDRFLILIEGSGGPSLERAVRGALADANLPYPDEVRIVPRRTLLFTPSGKPMRLASADRAGL
jgi:fatty-acyl-CoA synthase